MRMETRTGKVPVPEYSTARYPVASAKFFVTDSSSGDISPISVTEAKELLRGSRPAFVMLYPDQEKQRAGLEYESEPDLDPYFIEIARPGTLVVKVKLPDPPAEDSGEE